MLVAPGLLGAVISGPVALPRVRVAVPQGTVTFYSPSQRQADGYRTGGDVVVPRGGLVFPCLAAGGRCPADRRAPRWPSPRRRRPLTLTLTLTHTGVG